MAARSRNTFRGTRISSTTPGTLGGYRKERRYGRLDCKDARALSAIADYVRRLGAEVLPHLR